MPELIMESGWAGPLEAPLARIAEVATGGASLRLLRGGARLAFGLPENREAARVVLGLYEPQRWKGRLLRMAGAALLATGAYRRVLPVAAGAAKPAVDWLRPLAAEGSVGFMGCNPSHGLRCVLGGMDGDGAPFVAKLGFDHGREAILREARQLRSLGSSWPGIPPVLSLDEGPDWALLRLPHLGSAAPGHMDDPGVTALLQEWLREDGGPLGDNAWASELLEHAGASGVEQDWCARMRGVVVRGALVHGDFAVWNLRRTDRGLVAIDWEWAVEDGIGGLDLAYGLRQEALLVDRLDPAAAVRHILGHARKHPASAYLTSCGWNGREEDWLRLALLHCHLVLGDDSAPLLAELGIQIGPATVLQR